MEEAEYLFKVYLTCDPSRLEDLKSQLIKLDRKLLQSVLKLPEDSEERFRVYDLIIKILPCGQELLNHVFEECQDSSDPINQLVAIQFVNDNKLNSIDTFIKIFRDNTNDPSTLPSIAQTIVPMIMKSPNPEKYTDIVETIIQKSFSLTNDLLGSLPPLVKNDTFAKMMLNNEDFKLWIIDFPHKIELRTFNLYMRNLLASHTENGAGLLLTDKQIIDSLNSPNPSLRCATFDHIAIMSKFFKDQILAIPRIQERIFDVSMDSTLDERRARDRATNALGLTRPAANGSTIPTSSYHEEVGPDVMVI
ncbi:hypothetical protein M9Y10_009857 [Tritrichomonas musculus]|uniref:Uncharacterized protein n=1 Tax=Tritrichomonas musculus TaxID=1915356 RepID=A0ABR2IQV2_9EUKA